MAKEPLAAVGHVVHIYDFRVKPGTGDAFIVDWDAADKSGLQGTFRILDPSATGAEVIDEIPADVIAEVK